jgi:hypothetical protein
MTLLEEIQYLKELKGRQLLSSPKIVEEPLGIVIYSYALHIDDECYLNRYEYDFTGSLDICLEKNDEAEWAANVTDPELINFIKTRHTAAVAYNNKFFSIRISKLRNLIWYRLED